MLRSHRAGAAGAEPARARSTALPPPRDPPGGPRPPIDLAPASVHEAITRQMVERVAEDLAEIKSRLDGLLFMVAGAIVLDVVMRLAALR